MIERLLHQIKVEHYITGTILHIEVWVGSKRWSNVEIDLMQYRDVLQRVLNGDGKG